MVVHEAKIHYVVYDDIGPKPGNEIDDYLSPLIDDLRKLWDEGVSSCQCQSL